MGRKSKPCPNEDVLLAAYIRDSRPCIVAREIGATHKQVRRWLSERGIPLPPRRVQRPRGITPRYVRIANTPGGRRVKARLYNIWDSMHKRCYYPKQNRYERYGGRGIEVCAEWHEYGAFRAWAISHGYVKGLTLDRIDTDGHYAPGNCRWIDPKFQQWNSSRTIFLTLNGVTKPLPQWSDELGVQREVLRVRHRNGWPDEHALTVPHGQRCPGLVYQKPGRKPKGISPSSGGAPNV